MIVQPHNATLVYHDTHGDSHTQPITDVASSGTLIDPHTDNDMAISHVLVAKEPNTKNTLRKDADEALVVYIDSRGFKRYQVLSELVPTGTLSDPYTDDDMTIDHITV